MLKGAPEQMPPGVFSHPSAVIESNFIALTLSHPPEKPAFNCYRTVAATQQLVLDSASIRCQP
jgi:hypothetical protein